MASDSLRIGRIWGISISLHWTFILLLLFVLLFYPINIFAIFLLLFVCVFIHETAHAYTALRNKIKVKDILLTPLGGATSLDDNNIDYKREFNVAVTGPLMSIFLGGVFGVLAAISPPGAIVFVLQEMFVLNIALGVLNILPAFPLDGGRVFRSYLQRKRNQFDATMLTAKLSKYVAGLTMLASVVYLYYENFSIDVKALDFIIFAFVAIILYGGAEAERQNALLRRDTAGLTIAKAITKQFITVSPKTSLKALYKAVEDSGMSTVLTKVDNRFMLLDIFRRQPVPRSAGDLAMEMPVMKPNTPIIDAVQKLEGVGRGIAIVVSRGRPVGVITLQHINALISLHLLEKRSGNHPLTDRPAA